MRKCTCGSYALNFDRKICDVCYYKGPALDLLAIIHRDGGQHTEKVGFKKSCKDAEKRYYQILSKVEGE